jgi:outer membrane protein assembly factor BamB
MFRSVTAGLMLAAAQLIVGSQASRAAAAMDPPLATQSQYAVAYQINVGHSGNIAFTTPLTTPLKQSWSVNLGGTVSYPLIADGYVFVIVNNNELFALDLAAGATKWEKLLSGGWNALAYDRGLLFDINQGGQLFAIKAASGKAVWDVQLPGQYYFSSPPTAQKGMVFTGGAGSGGTLYGVDEKTGNVVWTQGVENGDSSSPALGDGGVFVSYPCQYYGFAPATGDPVWHHNGPCEGGGGETPVYFGNKVYVLDSLSGNFVLDAKTGKSLGSFAGSMPPAFYTASDNKSYMLSLSGKLFSSRTSTGNVAWTFTGDGSIDVPPIVVNGLVIAGSGAGNLYVLDGLTGAQLWSGKLSAGVQTSMAAGQGTIVVPNGNAITAFVAQ